MRSCSYTLLILSSTWKKWLGFKDGGRRPVCSTTKRVSEYCCVSHSFDLWALDSGKNMVSFAKFQDYKVVVSNPLYLIFASLDVHVLSCSQRMTGYAAAFSSNIIYQGFSQAFLSTIRKRLESINLQWDGMILSGVGIFQKVSRRGFFVKADGIPRAFNPGMAFRSVDLSCIALPSLRLPVSCSSRR